MSLPRGRCALCLKRVALRKGGLVREHYSRPGATKVCEGSGKAALREDGTPGAPRGLKDYAP